MNVLNSKTQRLFEYISRVYSIGLPVIRHVRDYNAELWWQADLSPCSQLVIKQFYDNDVPVETEKAPDDIWLSIVKRDYDAPPAVPPLLGEWIDLSRNPLKQPAPKPSILRNVLFESNPERVATFSQYIRSWQRNPDAEPPEVLDGWLLEKTPSEDLQPLYKPRREIEERFEDVASRPVAFRDYLEQEWSIWSKRVLPLFKANQLYDQMFSLHQRLSVEGDRLEILWGHLLLTWAHSPGSEVYHPLVTTAVNLIFEPENRVIKLSPSQTIPPKLDMGCLLELEFPNKDKVISLVRTLNDAEMPPDGWDANQMRGLAASLTGLMSNEAAEETNLYSDDPAGRPAITPYPAIYNAPVVFIRERTRRLWVDDAKKIALAVKEGAKIPPFIRSLMTDQSPNDLFEPVEQAGQDLDEDGGELFFPLEYNDQQKDIAERLKQHFGVLVQGPPGTGKSHTIANIICSLLARGKRVLVTSQTENALKVLRGYIPKEIRSLCVSQLGNDTEAKKQLNEAVTAIGNNLSEKGSHAIERAIARIKQDLRASREEQAKIRNQIKAWVELDASSISIEGEAVTAVQAAKECAEKEAAHAWFPDELDSAAEPPLSFDELRELCVFINTISAKDISECQRYLPTQAQFLPANEFTGKVAELRACKVLADETLAERQATPVLLKAPKGSILQAITALEDALFCLQELRAEWQHLILALFASQANQAVFWCDFYGRCHTLREKAWNAYRIKQGNEISATLPGQIDFDAGFQALEQAVNRGKNLSKWWSQIGLPEPAKLLIKHVTVNGFPLVTLERISVARHHFVYEDALEKIRLLWNQTFSSFNGPQLDFAEGMPLASVDSRLQSVSAILEWTKNPYQEAKQALADVGIGNPSDMHTKSLLARQLRILNGQIAEIEANAALSFLNSYADFIGREAQKENASSLWHEFIDAVKNHAPDDYATAYGEMMRLNSMRGQVERLNHLAHALKPVAPLWHAQLEHKAATLGAGAIEPDWRAAWRWKRLNNWLLKLHGRESVEDLQHRLEKARQKEHELVTELVSKRTWQRQIANVKDKHYRALVAWSKAMDEYGAGTGKHAPKWLAAAARAMGDAVGAVPAWIMPLHKVIMSFEATSNLFDVIITDEASQCDLRSLSVLFRGEKVLVVGDPEQISPSSIGVPDDKVFELMRQFLHDIPHAQTTFNLRNSLFHITRSIPRSTVTLLTEHFRCVPQIIEFNNHLCPTYGGRLEPLRQPNPHEKIEPAIDTFFVETGFKDGDDVNAPEAEALVELLVKCCRDERYQRSGKGNRKRTMGVISLLGEKQAKYISRLIAERLDETEREERQIICGDAYAFQGDERDVMFLSLVIANNTRFSAQTGDDDRQRFNVATSRARDQVFLFHSVKLGDIKNTNCVRYKLLNWYMSPPLAEREAGLDILKRKAESPFELEVGERIIRRGYKVIPQYRPFPNDTGYRIDLVVQGDKSRVAVECDGDRWHGPERWDDDQRREAQLRRAGWKFWRIGGSAFYRNKDGALESLWQFLKDEGIEPFLSRQDEKGTATEDAEQDSSGGTRHPSVDTAQSESHATLEEYPPLHPVESIVCEQDGDAICIGSIVKVYDEITDRKYVYKIGVDDGKPGYVSPNSPVGRALIGCRLNDIVELETPAGTRCLEIVEIIQGRQDA